MYLPNNLTNAIYDYLGATYNADQKAAFVDCDRASSANYIDFTFSSPTIRVPLDEIIIVAGTDRGRPVCIVGIGYTDDFTPVLGDTFLRSAYVVYDITSNEISIAQTEFDATTEIILEITNSTGVPSATVVQDAVTSVAVGSDGARIGGFGPVNVAPMATPPPAWNVALLGAAGAAAAFAL